MSSYSRCGLIRKLSGEALLISFQTGGGSLLGNWLDKIKILWRYGYKAPTKTQELYVRIAAVS